MQIPIELKVKESLSVTKAVIKDLEIKDNKELFFNLIEVQSSGNP